MINTIMHWITISIFHIKSFRMRVRFAIFFVVLALGLSAHAQTENQTFFKRFNCLMSTQWTDNDLKQFLDKNGFEMRYVLYYDTMRFATNVTDVIS